MLLFLASVWPVIPASVMMLSAGLLYLWIDSIRNPLILPNWIVILPFLLLLPLSVPAFIISATAQNLPTAFIQVFIVIFLVIYGLVVLIAQRLYRSYLLINIPLDLARVYLKAVIQNLEYPIAASEDIYLIQGTYPHSLQLIAGNSSRSSHTNLLFKGGFNTCLDHYMVSELKFAFKTIQISPEPSSKHHKGVSFWKLMGSVQIILGLLVFVSSMVARVLLAIQ